MICADLRCDEVSRLWNSYELQERKKPDPKLIREMFSPSDVSAAWSKFKTSKKNAKTGLKTQASKRPGAR